MTSEQIQKIKDEWDALAKKASDEWFENLARLNGWTLEQAHKFYQDCYDKTMQEPPHD